MRVTTGILITLVQCTRGEPDISLARSPCVMDCFGGFYEITDQVLGGVRLTELWLGNYMDMHDRVHPEMCSLLHNKSDCFTNCEHPYNDLFADRLQTDKIVQQCVDTATEFENMTTNCLIEFKDDFVEACGGSKEAQNMDNMVKLGTELGISIKEDFAKVMSAEFRQHFGPLCDFATAILQCAVPVMQTSCGSPDKQISLFLSIIAESTPGDMFGECQQFTQLLNRFQPHQNNL